MSRALPWALLGIVVVLCLWHPWQAGPVRDPTRDAHIDSAATVQAMDSAAIAHADTVLARAARDSSVTKLADSAAALGARLDVLDRLAARIRRANQARKDSIAGLTALVDTLTDTVEPTFDLDTVTTEIAADTGDVSCESRYAGRLEQLSLLGQALDRCRARGDTVRMALIGVRDTLARTKHYVAISDSMLKWERDRERPCNVNMYVFGKPSCALVAAEAGGGGMLLGLILGLVAH